jgi:hypothetical protein
MHFAIDRAQQLRKSYKNRRKPLTNKRTKGKLRRFDPPTN